MFSCCSRICLIANNRLIDYEAKMRLKFDYWCFFSQNMKIICWKLYFWKELVESYQNITKLYLKSFLIFNKCDIIEYAILCIRYCLFLCLFVNLFNSNTVKSRSKWHCYTKRIHDNMTVTLFRQYTLFIKIK